MNPIINIEKLNQEMHYEPLWYIDQKIFITLLVKSHLDNQDLLAIARLHVKYKHILCRSEIQACFHYLIQKANCNNIDEIYNITRRLYNDSFNEKIR